ncbi:MAG: cadmium-translocating P-type ATPase [Clostridia bacterium]|nr:cadmium-translocating P-type ATPase [Clostridia bacterium]
MVHEHGCGCSHEHHHGHEHEHEHHHGHEHDCGCSHEHHHENEHEHSCGCGHDHGFVLESSCGCGHDHGTTEEKIPLVLLLAVPLYLIGFVLHGFQATALFVAVYVLTGFEPIKTAVTHLFHGNFFDENFLMTVASLGAMAIGKYPEGCAVMLLYRIGEYLQDRAVGASMHSIDSLLQLCPETAIRLENGEEHEIDAELLREGDSILVRPGDRIAADGVVLSGESYLDLSALTGESVPVSVSTGDEVLSGTINQDGVLTVRVLREANASAAARVIRLVEQASREKAPTEDFITKFSRWYTPAVCAIAVLLVLILGGFKLRSWADAFYSACVLLVISCPCALAISVPLGFFAGLGAASRRGVLFKGGNYLEAMGEVRRLVLDKTGTLTNGRLEVEEVRPAIGTAEELLKLAAAAEASSGHPAAKAVVAAAQGDLQAENMREHAGRGVSCTVEGAEVLCGNERLLRENGVKLPQANGAEAGTSIRVAKDGVYLGSIVLRDELRPEAAPTLQRLRELGVEQITMLTGDSEAAAAPAARAAGVDNYLASLLPQDKVTSLTEIKGSCKKGERCAYVGDGINDAPVLALADIGISMGMGTAAAIEASDVVLAEESLAGLASAMEVSQATRRIVRQNIVFSLGVKLLVMILAAAGYSSMWAAVFADVGVALLAILNSARLLKR